jgi:acetoacetate decarboxylase
VAVIDAPVIARRTVQGRLDTTALPSNQPATGPLYPKLPWKAFNSKAIVITYETDLDPVLDVLPPELSPLTERPEVRCVLIGGSELAIGGGVCAEMSVLIPVLYDDEPHLYQWMGYLGEGTEEAFAASREMLGEQRKLARIELRQEVGRGLMLGTVERPSSHRLVTQIVGPLERQCDAGELAFPPIIGIRILPDSSGRGIEMAELYRRQVDTTIRRASDGSPMLFSGPGTIVLGASTQDPIAKLPARDVLGAHYVEFGTIAKHAGEVLKRYATEDRTRV